MKGRTKTLVIAVFVLSLNFSFAQLVSEPFTISVEPQGVIAGTHFSVKAENTKLVIFSSACNRTEADFHELAKELTGQGYHVITYDLRGHGNSTAPLSTKDKPKDKVPIYDQETHDSLEKNHGSDLNLVYQKFRNLIGGLEQVVIGLTGCTMSWSFDMLSSNPEIKNLVLLTSYFGEQGESYLKENSDLNILAVTSKAFPRYLELTKTFFETNSQHNLQWIECEKGYSSRVFNECKDIQKGLIDWFSKLN